MKGSETSDKTHPVGQKIRDNNDSGFYFENHVF